MMYPEPLLIPMRQELTRLGIEELKTAADVDAKTRRAQGHGDGRRELGVRMRRTECASGGGDGHVACGEA